MDHAGKEKITEPLESSDFEPNYQLEFQEFLSFKDNYNDEDFEEEISLLENGKSGEIDEFNTEEFDAIDTADFLPATTLNDEEQSAIDVCTDPDLKEILMLNRSKNLQLIQLHKQISNLLNKCEDVMEEKNSLLKRLKVKHVNPSAPSWRLAAPYFKDKKFFACPLNEDTIRKRRDNELSIYDVLPLKKWTPIEFSRLSNAVKCNYNINRQNNIVKMISELKANIDEEDRAACLEKITKLQEELERIQHDEEFPPLNCNKFIDWYKVSETFLKDKRTPSECQSVWHRLIHPDINKSDWTEEENKQLESIATKYQFQDWDSIAKELGTKRTGLTTCLHYHTKLCEKFKKDKFTPEEDKLLSDVVDIYKNGNFIPWNKVVHHFTNRTRHQLYHRYTYFLSHSHVKKGKFSEAEDILLLILVEKFGRNFRKCAEFMPLRSQMQLKSRYNTNLQIQIKKGTYSLEDDQAIYEYVQKYGEKRWGGLTDKLKRCRGQIRQRYRLIKTFLEANPEAQIADIPRRKHQGAQGNEEQYTFLRYMVDQFKNMDCIPTIAMIEECLQVEEKSRLPEKASSTKAQETKVQLKNIDALLTDFFSNSMKLKQARTVTQTHLDEAALNIETILSILGANLDIPTDFESYHHLENLDNFDIEILGRLSKKKVENKRQLNQLVAPNTSTLLGLRSLIIKHKYYKKSRNMPGTSKIDNTQWTMQQNLLKMDELTRSEIVTHRDLFSKRFDSLFHWSAILSLEKPRLVEAEPPSSPELPVVSKRAVEEEPNSVQPEVKKRKVEVSTLQDLIPKEMIDKTKLKLVDKSVVDKLMKCKRKINIIKIETVTDTNGVTRQVLRQNPTNNNTVKSASKSSAVSLVDKYRKNGTNQTDISETKSSTNLVDGQYENIQNDPQLLQELEKYDSNKNASDNS